MSKPELMQYVESLVERKEFPSFKAGDTITVSYKIKEGNNLHRIAFRYHTENNTTCYEGRKNSSTS